MRKKDCEIKTDWAKVPRLASSKLGTIHTLEKTINYESSSMDFASKNTGVGSYFLLQGIFPTQGSNLGLLPCRQILYHLRH